NPVCASPKAPLGGAFSVRVWRASDGNEDRVDARERRLAQNETLFRSVNERIEQAAKAGGVDEHVFRFLCECSNVDCNLQVPLTVPEYEMVREDPTQFVVAPGHDLPEI